ncbi:FG-GAP repeat domain-containing protein [Corallococcus terminator]|uniref:VCBS repeat-containing protein n=1 Tax=Corallococcus terminator TaxID=2316733 RepID=A0A3A8IY65_9BACT|nr:VCBS repeat-containing protein [Corallococcus terminator]RKG88407.1 VCBS repeat-containing protein [Corallococcus terminator]
MGHPPSGASRVALADATGDKNADILVAGKGFVSVLPGNGNGEFGKAITSITDVEATSFAVHEVNMDARVDVVVASNKAPGVTLLLNQDNGTFTPFTTFLTLFPVSAVALADFTDDGKPDLLLVEPTLDRVVVYVNTSGDPDLNTERQVLTPR